MIDWLLDGYLTFSDKYFMHFHDDNKFTINTNKVTPVIEADRDEDLGNL